MMVMKVCRHVGGNKSWSRAAVMWWRLGEDVAVIVVMFGGVVVVVVK